MYFCCFIFYSPACLQGWIQFQTECYQLKDTIKNWHNAESDCLNKNSDLVYILTVEEEQFIDSQLINKSTVNEVFIGLKENSDNGNFFQQWSSGDNIDYTNWQANTTAGSLNGTACVAKNKSESGQWAIVECLEMKPYICKRQGMTHSVDNVSDFP